MLSSPISMRNSRSLPRGFPNSLTPSRLIQTTQSSHGHFSSGMGVAWRNGKGHPSPPSSRIASSLRTAPRTASSRTELKTVAVTVTTASDCSVAVGPLSFSYDASKGNGRGRATFVPGSSLYSVSVDPNDLYIPPLDASNGRLKGFLPLMLPPNFEVAILPSHFNGTLDVETGKLELMMKANFAFRFGAITVRGVSLTMPMSTGPLQGGRDAQGRIKPEGRRWNRATGSFMVVGRSKVLTTGNPFMDKLVQTPADAFIELSGRLHVPSVIPSAATMRLPIIRAHEEPERGREETPKEAEAPAAAPAPASSPTKGEPESLKTCADDEEIPCELQWSTSDDEGVSLFNNGGGFDRETAGSGAGGEKRRGPVPTAGEDQDASPPSSGSGSGPAK